MKYQIAGLTYDYQYDKCLEILRGLGLPTERRFRRIALFDTREQAEVVLPLFQASAPDAEFRIDEIPEAALQAASI